MILRRISLLPFAGFAGREIALEPGLNVIRGPNDVGKSTLFRAIDATLFLPTRLKANTVEGRELKRIIPLGGDHACARLEIEADRGTYRIEKSWGATPSVSLQLPDGTRLTAIDRVEEELRKILPVPAASFRSVLFVSQNALDRTIQDLAEHHESLHTLGDALRLAVNQTDGVSVDRVQALVREKLEAVFLNWDIPARAPRKNRGIENPWDRRGTLLDAYYSREHLRRKLAETQSIETELGEKARRLSERLARQAQLRKFVSENEGAVEGVSARRAIDLQLGQADRDAQAISRDLAAWMQAETDRGALEPEVSRLEKVIEGLGRELREARLRLEREGQLDRFRKIERARQELDARRANLSETPPVRAEDLQRLRQGWGTIERLKTGLSASRLEFQLTAKLPVGIRVQRDLDREKKETVEPGTPLTIRAGGRILLSTEQFDLVVTSGDGGISRIEEELRRESENLRKLLKALDSRSLEEAQERHEKWTAASQNARAAEIALNALLAGESYEKLQALYGSPGPDPSAPADGSGAEPRAPIGVSKAPGRDPDQVERDYASAHGSLADRRAELAARMNTIREIRERHAATDPAGLTSLVIARGVEREKLRAELDALPPLPDGIGDVTAYLDAFRNARSELLTVSEELREISNAVVDLKARAPEHSAQEIDRQHREAGAVFEREFRRGQALLRVSQVIEAQLHQDGDVYEGFRSSLERDLSRFSAGKYPRARMQGAVPVEFHRDDGALIPFTWLSAGTRDGFALCLRLAMARQFLGESRGFVLLDDPMVAMDPGRRNVACGILAEFAEHAQLVVFTCHPEHAKLLGGHALDL